MKYPVPKKIILEDYIVILFQLICFIYLLHFFKNVYWLTQSIWFYLMYSVMTHQVIPSWFVEVVTFKYRLLIWLCCFMSLQKCKSLHFPTKTVEMPSTDALPYLMYKAMRGALADLKDSLDETLEREFNRISDKGMSLLPRITIKMILCLEILKSKYSHFACLDL